MHPVLADEQCVLPATVQVAICYCTRPQRVLGGWMALMPMDRVAQQGSYGSLLLFHQVYERCGLSICIRRLQRA
jgi:hypothetical protein